jgi:rSAM/selenodomain-associated transferase 2
MSSQESHYPPVDVSSSTGDSRRAASTTLTVIVPTLNEAATIEACLRRLASLRARGVQVIVADGGSVDDTTELARPFCDALIRSARGRAVQMNAGARAASGDVLLFLHADTELPADAHTLILDALGRRSSQVWGRFDVRISGHAGLLRLVGKMICIRSRLTGVATGDQAIFCYRGVFMLENGFPQIPVMEDVAFSKQLRRRSPPICLGAQAITSGRRWETHGVIRTIVLMWWLRLAYVIGVPPTTLSRWYRYSSGKRPVKHQHNSRV